MSLEISGKITAIYPTESGEGKNGQWKKRGFVIEYLDGNYPKNLYTYLWGDKVTHLDNFKVGESVTIKFNISSREYNERWYTEAQTWSIQNVSLAPVTDNPDDDLPF